MGVLSKIRRHGWLGGIAGLAIAAACAMPLAAAAAPARDLITSPIDETAMVEIRGNIRPELATARDLGAVAPDRVFEHLYLLLKRPPEREAALRAFMEAQTTPGSPDYRKWIGAAEMDATYGPSKRDVAAVAAWLRSHGIRVNAYMPSLVLDVDATAAQLQAAFGLKIHTIVANGERHIASVNNPSVPVALRGVLLGPPALHDFRPHTMKRRAWKRSQPDPVTHQYAPGSGYELVAPGDLQTIYNLPAVYAQGYSGAGETVGLIEDTNLYSLGDWYAFRKIFGLSRPYPHATLTQINPGCASPGVNGADSEAALDVEWASAAAPNAAIAMYACADSGNNFGGFVAMTNMYAAGTYPSIISISYGEGESVSGATYNAYIDTLYQEYAAAGVSLFVSSGDSLSNQNDRGATVSTHGISVSSFAGTAYNVSVGGTDFADTYLGTVGNYWSNTNTPYFANALSYIPEIPWNNTCADPLFYTTYYARQPVTEAVWTGSISGSTLTVTSVAGGIVYNGLTVVGPGIAPGTTIIADLTGTAGGVGTYNVSISQAVASEAMSGTNALSANTAVAACSNTYLYAIGYASPAGGAGGPSNCFSGTPATAKVSNGSCTGKAKPSWQSVYGNPGDGVRDQPDVALFAANGLWGHYYPFCFSDPTSGYGGAQCTDNPGSWSGAGGTSFASPVMAGIFALVQQKVTANTAGATSPVKLGNPNPVLYSIGAQQYGTGQAATGTTTCNSGATGGPAAGCVFNNVQLGDISSPCKKLGSSAYNCYIASGTTGINSQSNSGLAPVTPAASAGGVQVGAFPATPGWNFATGLGSVNGYNLVNNPAWQAP